MYKRQSPGTPSSSRWRLYDHPPSSQNPSASPTKLPSSKFYQGKSHDSKKIMSNRKESQSRSFRVKKGNFFNHFNGQDEETSHSESDIDDDTSNRTRSVSDTNESSSYYSDNSSTPESLPFEFGLDSENGSVISMHDLPRISEGHGFLDVHPVHLSDHEEADESSNTSEGEFKDVKLRLLFVFVDTFCLELLVCKFEFRLGLFCASETLELEGLENEC